MSAAVSGNDFASDDSSLLQNNESSSHS